MSVDSGSISGASTMGVYGGRGGITALHSWTIYRPVFPVADAFVVFRFYYRFT